MDRVDAGEFKNSLPPPTPWKIGCEPSIEDRLARKRYEEESQVLAELFALEAIHACGLTGHPKANKAFTFAWNKGFEYSEVLGILEELADLLT